MDNLTIAIPTYNRKERLIQQIGSVLSQPLSGCVKILVLNNNSDYDVEDSITKEFGCSCNTKIDIINNRSNVGMSLNIALPFYYCKTKWLWILSDDDRTTPDSLNIIRSDMKTYSDYTCIKYSLEGLTKHNNQTFTTLEELVDYYGQEDKSQGEFIFISNNLFNMEKIEPLIGDIISFSYNAVAGILPFVFGLDSGGHKVFMSSKNIVLYLRPKNGSEWNYIEITTRVAALADYPYQSKGVLVRKLMDRMNHFSFYSYLDALIKLNDKEKVKIHISKTFPVLFRNGFCHRALYMIIYYAYILFDLNVVSLLRKIKQDIK